jgi:hypothetical protein
VPVARYSGVFHLRICYLDAPENDGLAAGFPIRTGCVCKDFRRFFDYCTDENGITLCSRQFARHFPFFLTISFSHKKTPFH